MKINPRVAVMREVTTKVVSILASKHIKVTQRGTRAYVEYHSKTLEVLRVNIPFIPDDANDELLDAIQGFIDHELGHIFHTDPKSLVEAKKQGVGDLHNALEDTYVERMQREKFKGAAFNLESVGRFFLKNFTDKKIKEDPAKRVGYLMIPAIRAWSGQLLFKEYMDDGDKWVHLEDVTKRLGPLVNEIPKINSSFEAVALAVKMRDALKGAAIPEKKKEPPKPPKETKPKKDEKFEPAPGGEEEDPSGDPGESPGSEGAGGPKPGKGETGTAPKKEKGETPAEKEETPAPGAGEEDETFSETSERDEIYTGEDDAEGTAEDGEMGDAEFVDGDDDDEEYSEGESGEGGDASKAGTVTTGEVDDGLEGEAKEGSGDDMSSALEGMADYDDAISEAIGEVVAAAAKESDYVIWTRDFDRIEEFTPPSDSGAIEARLRMVQQNADTMVGVMQKDLERAIAARNTSVWRGGLRSGRLNASSLSRLALKDDRVFRRREVSVSKDVALTLLVDNSGSMSHNARIQKAAEAAFALSSVLDRMNITHEVIGYTTTDTMPAAEQEKAMREAGVIFGRTEAIYMPVYKAFDERLSTEAKKRIVGMSMKGYGFLRENVDGESVQIAAGRLRARKESRHIMMVLSDGNPACSGDRGALIKHLKDSVALVERSGVETIGIGIETSSVSNFYPKHVVLNDVKDLAGEVMQKLRQILLR